MSQDQRGGLVGVGREERVWRGVRSPRERVIRVWRVRVRVSANRRMECGKRHRARGAIRRGAIRGRAHSSRRPPPGAPVRRRPCRGCPRPWPCTRTRRWVASVRGIGAGGATSKRTKRAERARRSCGEATDVQLCEAPQGTYFVRRGGAAAAAWLRERERRDTAARSMCASAEAQGGRSDEGQVESTCSSSRGFHQ